MRNRTENILWIAGAVLAGVGAVGDIKVVILCGALVLITAYGYKTFVKRWSKDA